ncbi:MFS transporter, partial [Candidatus Woesebacteria bacterium]|nr:MFS transporter [Candidatus Woesebacteria bacterium]
MKSLKTLLKDISVRNTWIFYVTQVCHSLIFPIPIWIVYYLGVLTPAQLTATVIAQYASQMVMELPSGALADIIGRKKTIVLGFLITGVGYLIFPLAGTFLHFLALSILFGIGDSFRSGSEEALIYDSYKQVGKESAFRKAFAHGSMLYQVGLIVSTAAGGFLYQYGHAIPFVLYGLLLLVGTLVTLAYVEPVIDSVTFSLKNYLAQILDGSKEAFKNNYTKNLSLFYIVVGGITWSSALYFNAYMLVDLIPQDGLRGVLGASMRLINVVLIVTVLKNEKLFNWQKTIVFFPIILAVGYLPGIWIEGFIGVPFVQLIMIASTARWILLSPLTNAVFSSKYRATAISLLSLLIGFVYIGTTTISMVIIPLYGIKTMQTLL